MIDKIPLIKNLKHKSFAWALFIFLSFVSMICLFVIGLFTYALLLGPPSLSTAQPTTYFSSDGEEIGQEKTVETRDWLELEQIDRQVIDTTIQAEDKRFYEHHGFDFKRMLAAAITNVRSLALEEGASTITQQYARNLFLSHEKTWDRKLKEAFHTIRLELFYDKDTLLEGYLNTIYYGHGVYGVEAASQFYFQKQNTELTLAETALLVGIPNRPSYYSPIRHIDHAKQRQEQLLDSLLDDGKIDSSEHLLASLEHVTVYDEQQDQDKNLAPYFQDIVMNELQSLLKKEKEMIRTAGYRVYTTLDQTKQLALQRAASESMPKDSDLQVGAIAMDPSNGAIHGLIGGTNYIESPFNRATQAKRMAGSTFKPFLYYTALMNGYTATTTLMSQPTTFMLEDGTSYQPSNYNGYYADKEVTLAQALAVSDNVYAVKTNLFLTPERLIETAKTFGISSNLKPVASLALGPASVSVKEMVTAYSMLANGGKFVEPYTIEKIETANGEVIYQRVDSKKKQVLDPQATFILTQLMTGMFDPTLNGYMHVTGETIASDLTNTYAGKSGTTKSDSWMIGYSPHLVTGVWNGYDDNRTMSKTVDQQAAKNIWADFMEASAEEKKSNFIAPEGIVAAYVDPVSGELSSAYCETSRLMYFVEGTEPVTYCSLHRPKN
ncbi:transglycosylase domain-containing protein [Paraliobacillus salinarum]|uniref:transglycosylase domain-containing protein n=1 Tax=Paraliobacillus salinarum TaxID=1158996 RepID=UPI001FEC71F0|nr:transglycosylase domain-containing protein [Paraliobacillus salinarum]